ncbi:hypothetical protein [Acinetobacter tibetensis]|uniref:Uncharacterized protein n=1 Tax=Acinetobacter tibetensis TaxID=2943497 RepID=A0AAE9LTP8_9GAMM|nr:hypothetical protein [Acinetobacter tibetensis]USE84310.1 hypothetical protein M5E07_05790 [Acinetobacter tibetensis]
MKTEPWIEDCDPLKPYYGKLSNQEYTNISKIFTLWINHHNHIDPSVIHKNKKLNLLDYSNKYNGKCSQDLYQLLCESLKQTDGYLYWLPINSIKNKNTFSAYSPAMIAKTPIKTRYLDYASRSFLQMQNGGYAIIESNLNFIALVADGYYMQVALDPSFMNDQFQKYLDSWNEIENNLDETTAQWLSQAYYVDMNDVRDGLLLLEMDENSLEKYTYSLKDMKKVVIHALSESVSNYWPELALNWLQKKPEYLDSDVLYWIENLIKDKNKYSQKVRHLAIKIRKDFLEISALKRI